MKDRTESVIVMIAICFMIVVILVAISTHYELKNLNKRLDRQSEKIEIIFDVLKVDGEIFETLDERIDLIMEEVE